MDSAGTPQALTISTSGLTTFAAPVGATLALASLTTTGNGSVDINGGSVTTVTTAPTMAMPALGSQNYGGPVTLSANTTLTGYSLTLGVGLAGAGNNLALDFITQVTLPGAITGIGAFSTVGAGGALINGSFTTTGTQTYSGGNVTLAGNTGAHQHGGQPHFLHPG